MVERILALDLGPTSIGWALVEATSVDNAKLIDCGVRIFHSPVDAKTQEPLNRQRRLSRGARRQLRRRSGRRKLMRKILCREGLLPQTMAETPCPQALLNDIGDPYLLRAKALDEPLEPFQFGRVLFHLAGRRGFRSNRKIKSDAKEDGIVTKGIRSLWDDMAATDSRTLGEYLFRFGGYSKRRRFTDRAMYETEFEAIWNAQHGFNPHVAPDRLKLEIYRALFFQRPITLQRGLVGKCVLEPSRRRAARATLLAQHIRLLQQVNHLAVREPGAPAYRSLSSQERDLLRSELSRKPSLTWAKVRLLLGLKRGAVINLDDERATKLVGNTTSARLSEILGSWWEDKTRVDQESFVTDLLTIHDTNPLLSRLITHWNVPENTAEALCRVELEPGYARLSTKAMRRLEPFLEQGMSYAEACKAAGYDAQSRAKQSCQRLGDPPAVRNPVVNKVLHQVRRLVNAILDRHGRPDRIRIELARDLRMSKRERDAVSKDQAIRTKQREAARERLKTEFDEFSATEPRHADIEKYLLWEECGAECPYSGKPISRQMLFSAEVHVEHILPYARTFDDSFSNKTLCFGDLNAIKGNQTPYEAFHSTGARYFDILKRIDRLPPHKRRRFTIEDLGAIDDVAARVLNDTRYLSVEARQYLETLGVHVDTTKGGTTAALRHRWGLNYLLSDDGTKNRDDHRHHAIDAIVIAVTSPAFVTRIARLSAEYGGASLRQRSLPIPPLNDAFRAQVQQRIATIVVSHQADRRIRGPLHKETCYGFVVKEQVFTVRKSVAGLSASEVARVRDPVVRQIIQSRIADAGGNIKKALATEFTHVDGRTPIRSVRVTDPASPNTMFARTQNGQPIGHYALGSNHHIEILEDIRTGQWKGVVVSMLEAARRARSGTDLVVQRDHGEGFRFVMSLGIGETVAVGALDAPSYYRVQKIAAGKYPEITLAPNVVAHVSEVKPNLRPTPNSLKALTVRKISVGILGDISQCND